MTLSAAEQHVADKVHRIGKFYMFLRAIRADLFDEAFEAELAAAYQPRGVAPLPPALQAMVTCWRPTIRSGMRKRSSRPRSTSAGRWRSGVSGPAPGRFPKARW